ncbi:hypothetical protein BDZ85DRAFT_262367 [Elsinoe ampelina]|uniref:Uncharacterized protein n=1 Tax=Elsinoe ampelina TaxID=302913 RepID=A0A6A6GE17_9PEZI|nr:hypothetical protein BDZ85DRAFT_262367 [Elsinoe ampelina]
MCLTLSTSLRVLRGPAVVVRLCAPTKQDRYRPRQSKPLLDPAVSDNPQPIPRVAFCLSRPSLPFLRWEKQGRATEHATLLPPFGLAAISE